MEHDRFRGRDAVSSRPYPNTRNTVRREEDRHAWRARHYQSHERPLMRIWDRYSGSQPIEGRGMKSRAPDMRLDTFQKRRSALADHLDHKKWASPGPYISCTTSPAAIEDLARMRANKRGPQTLTVIDPNKRRDKGLPILDVPSEMESYDIPDPYGKGNQYNNHHKVCPWEVTEAEIVGHWEWDALEQDQNWHETTIMPEFRSFTGAASSPPLDESHFIDPTAGAVDDDLLTNFNDLSSRLSTLTWTLWKLIFEVGHNDQDCYDQEDCYSPDFYDPDCSYPDCSHTDREDECENSYHDEDCYPDLDDEAEEVYIDDDIVESVEENW